MKTLILFALLATLNVWAEVYPQCDDGEFGHMAAACRDSSGSLLLMTNVGGSSQYHRFTGTFSSVTGGEGSFSLGTLKVRKALGSNTVFPGLMELKSGQTLEMACSLGPAFSCGEMEPFAREAFYPH